MSAIDEVIAEKVKALCRCVDQARFGGMQQQSGRGRPLLNHRQDRSRFFQAAAQHHKVSRAGESHPRALAEPDVRLSPHPAPLVQPRPCNSAQ